MAGISTSRGKNILGHRLAIGIVSALVFVSPAQAEITTLVCPLGDDANVPGTYTVDLDYAAGTITIEEAVRGSAHHFGPSAAVITDRAIKFELRDSSKEPGWPAGTWFTTIKGSIDRLAGTLAFTECGFYKGKEEGCGSHHTRCVRATQKF